MKNKIAKFAALLVGATFTTSPMASSPYSQIFDDITTSTTTVPGHFLNVGSYSLIVGITSYSPLKSHDRVEAAQFSVYDHETYPLQEMGSRGGILKPQLAWSSARLDREEIVASAVAPKGVGVP